MNIPMFNSIKDKNIYFKNLYKNDINLPEDIIENICEFI
jgi:hypothetical protein